MANLDKQFAGSIPEIYDRYLVPLIFESYARDIAGRVAKSNPAAVLETAAGTGVVTRALASMLSSDVRISVTDLNQPMLDVAERGLANDPRLSWRQADALALPFPDQSFDVVTCQFGVMFFPDKVQGFREARRVLKPGGKFIFNVWDRISENEFPDVVMQAMAKVFPQDPPRFMERVPHGYYDVERVREELGRAGFPSIAVEMRPDTSRAASPRDPAIAFCQGTPLRNEIEARDASRLQEATDVACDDIEKRFGSGPVEGRIAAHVFTVMG